MEDCSSGDSGSTKNSKQVHPANFFGAADVQNPVTHGSAAQHDQPQIQPQVQAIEDPNGTLHQELRVGQYPISIKFLMWQDSNIGNYIEFKLQVTYHEGSESSGQRSQVTSSPYNSQDLNA